MSCPCIQIIRDGEFYDTPACCPEHQEVFDKVKDALGQAIRAVIVQEIKQIADDEVVLSASIINP